MPLGDLDRDWSLAGHLAGVGTATGVLRPRIGVPQTSRKGVLTTEPSNGWTEPAPSLTTSGVKAMSRRKG